MKSARQHHSRKGKEITNRKSARQHHSRKGNYSIIIHGYKNGNYTQIYVKATRKETALPFQRKLQHLRDLSHFKGNSIIADQQYR
jgi:phage replication-related protein YjqB (UPF0714/DUF867 family)